MTGNCRYSADSLWLVRTFIAVTDSAPTFLTRRRAQAQSVRLVRRITSARANGRPAHGQLSRRGTGGPLAPLTLPTTVLTGGPLRVLTGNLVRSAERSLC